MDMNSHMLLLLLLHQDQEVHTLHLVQCYRRIPLMRHCSCGNQLIQTITRASVEKYLKLAKRLVEKYDVGIYLKERIYSLSDEIDLVFGKSKGDQSLLTDYVK